MVSCKVRQEFASTTRASPARLQNIWQSVIAPNLVGHSNHSTFGVYRTLDGLATERQFVTIQQLYPTTV